jgi:DHA3 family macrolide efflux protein-like MFS transporter
VSEIEPDAVAQAEAGPAPGAPADAASSGPAGPSAPLSPSAPPPSSSRALWALIGVETMCMLGSEVSRFGVSVWIYQATHSVLSFSILVLANTVPGMLVAPVAGSLVDRHPRKQVMIASAFVALFGTLIVLAGAATGRLSMAAIAAGAALASVAEAFQWPALAATVPLMTTEEELPRYNGFLESGRAVSNLAGPILGGLLFVILKLPGLLLVEVTTFLTATVVVSQLDIPRPAKAEGEAAPESLWKDSLFGLKWIGQHRPLLKFLLVAVYANFFLSIGIVLMPPYGLSFLSERAYGVTNGLFGGGMIAGGLLYAWLSRYFRNATLFLATAVIMGAIYTSYGFSRGMVSLAALNGLLAALMTIGNGAIDTLWQAKVPEAVAGRVLSAMRMVAYSTGPVSYLIAGPLTDDWVPALLARPNGFCRWVNATFGATQTGQMGFVFSAMGVLLVIGFVLSWMVEDVRNVEEHEV